MRFYLNTQLFCEINRNDEEWFFCSKLYLRSMGPLPKSSKSSSWHRLISSFLPEGRAGLRLPALLLASHGGQVWMRITQWDPFMQVDPPWDCCSPHLLKPMAMHGHHNSCWSQKDKVVAWSASMHNARLSATTAAGGTDFVSHQMANQQDSVTWFSGCSDWHEKSHPTPKTTKTKPHAHSGLWKDPHFSQLWVETPPPLLRTNAKHLPLPCLEAPEGPRNPDNEDGPWEIGRGWNRWKTTFSLTIGFFPVATFFFLRIINCTSNQINKKSLKEKNMQKRHGWWHASSTWKTKKPRGSYGRLVGLWQGQETTGRPPVCQVNRSIAMEETKSTWTAKEPDSWKIKDTYFIHA